MKNTFTKSDGRYTEKLDLSIEDKWIYIYYSQGGIEKTAYILKNNQKSNAEYLQSFFQENQVSKELIADVNSYLKHGEKTEKENWMKFSTFLIKAISYNLVIGLILGLSIFAGYKLGTKADAMLSISPLFTIIGVFTGISFGGYCGYIMIKHYLIHKDDGEQKVTPASRLSSGMQQQKSVESTDTQYPEIDVSLDQVRNAIKKFADELPNGTNRTILVNDDYSIDFSKLINHLGGIPSKKFYMSKETYDIFEETGKMIPEIMDKVQRAVDNYFNVHGKYPMLPYDPLRRVNFYELMQDHYLDSVPEFDFYVTDYDGIISHIKPKKAKRES